MESRVPHTCCFFRGLQYFMQCAVWCQRLVRKVNEVGRGWKGEILRRNQDLGERLTLTGEQLALLVVYVLIPICQNICQLLLVCISAGYSSAGDKWMLFIPTPADWCRGFSCGSRDAVWQSQPGLLFCKMVSTFVLACFVFQLLCHNFHRLERTNCLKVVSEEVSYNNGW